jgi:hypothetical protein
MAVRKAVVLSTPDQTDDLLTYLLQKGFRESGFMRICREYYHCPDVMRDN